MSDVVGIAVGSLPPGTVINDSVKATLLERDHAEKAGGMPGIVELQGTVTVIGGDQVNVELGNGSREVELEP